MRASRRPWERAAPLYILERIPGSRTRGAVVRNFVRGMIEEGKNLGEWGRCRPLDQDTRAFVAGPSCSCAPPAHDRSGLATTRRSPFLLQWPCRPKAGVGYGKSEPESIT